MDEVDEFEDEEAFLNLDDILQGIQIEVERSPVTCQTEWDNFYCRPAHTMRSHT